MTTFDPRNPDHLSLVADALLTFVRDHGVPLHVAERALTDQDIYVRGRGLGTGPADDLQAAVADALETLTDYEGHNFGITDDDDKDPDGIRTWACQYARHGVRRWAADPAEADEAADPA